MASKRPKAPHKRRKPAPPEEQPPRRPKLLLDQPTAKPRARPAPPTRQVARPQAPQAPQPRMESPAPAAAAPESAEEFLSVTVSLTDDAAPGSIGGQPIPPAHCLVICPSLAPIDHRTEEKLRELERRGYNVLRAKGFSAVEQGRNQMASEALQRGFLETLWIDPDVDFECDSVDRLRGHGLPIVCGLYPQKGKRALSCDVLPGTEKIVFGAEGGLTEVLYASCGFMLVQTAVYARIRDRLGLPLCNTRGGQPGIWPFFQDLIKPVQGVQVVEQGTGNREQETGDGGQEAEVEQRAQTLARYHPRNIQGYFLSHDFAFCERARQAGYQIMADTTLRLWHLGTYGYSWEEVGNDVERFDTYEYYIE